MADLEKCEPDEPLRFGAYFLWPSLSLTYEEITKDDKRRDFSAYLITHHVRRAARLNSEERSRQKKKEREREREREQKKRNKISMTSLS